MDGDPSGPSGPSSRVLAPPWFFFPYIQVWSSLSATYTSLLLCICCAPPSRLWLLLLHNPAVDSWKESFNPISLLVFRMSKPIFLSAPSVFKSSSPLNCPQEWSFADLSPVFSVFLAQGTPKLDTEYMWCHTCRYLFPLTCCQAVTSAVQYIVSLHLHNGLH